MSISRRTYRRDGRTYQSPTWHVQYTDHTGRQRRIAAFTDRRASDDLNRRLEELVACRSTGTGLSPRLARFIERLPKRILAHLRNVDLLDENQRAGALRLEDHVGEWEKHLRQKGDTEKHIKQRAGRVKRLLEEAGIRYWTDLDTESVENVLADWRAEEKKQWSIRTLNGYRSAVKQFCAWLDRTGRAPSNPLSHLSRQNPERDRRRIRRALTAEEAGKLLRAAAEGSDYQGVSGRERALLYRTALETGLRANELRTLKVSALDLEATPPTLRVEAGQSKNRKEATLPLRPALAMKLRDHCAMKLPNAPVFSLGRWTRTAEMLKADLEAAEVKYEDDSGRIADFHALRMTFVTNLAKSGVHPRVAQELARHSDVKLTLEVYTHVALESKTDAVAMLPDFDAAEEDETATGQE